MFNELYINKINNRYKSIFNFVLLNKLPIFKEILSKYISTDIILVNYSYLTTIIPKNCYNFYKNIYDLF